MSSTRPRLTLDEQSFQGLLAAAFTIQEHNDKLLRAALEASKGAPISPAKVVAATVCANCGATVKDGETLCPQCRSTQPRPGERMQHKWASLWEMSRERSVRHAPPEDRGKSSADVKAPEPLEPSIPRILEVGNGDIQDPGSDVENEPQAEPSAEPNSLALADRLSTICDDLLADNSVGQNGGGDGTSRFDLRRLGRAIDQHRADVYLGIAIFVAGAALLWPMPNPFPKPRLPLWERTLVSLGIAEAPTATPLHYRGNPNVQVWIDPHTALYYCPGDDQYGKTVGGRLSLQRDAQSDQFKPAGRAPCQ